MASPEILLQLDNISRLHYLGKTEIYAVQNVSVCINKGDFVVLAGPSGSGKTSLLNIIGCIDKPSAGKVIFDGEDISSRAIEKLSDLRLNRIGFIFQSFNLVPVLTAFENVELPLLFKGYDDKKIKQLAETFLHRVGLSDKLHQKPPGLSGGQRQRLAIARALAGGPSLIVGDEPTASLDRKNAESIVALLKELNEEYGITIVLASHDPMIIEQAGTKLFMRDGSLVNN
jgi:putative ABC transport system ATP-binding protein